MRVPWIAVNWRHLKRFEWNKLKLSRTAFCVKIALHWIMIAEILKSLKPPSSLNRFFTTVATAFLQIRKLSDISMEREEMTIARRVKNIFVYFYFHVSVTKFLSNPADIAGKNRYWTWPKSLNDSVAALQGIQTDDSEDKS